MLSGVPGYESFVDVDKNKLPKNLDWKIGCKRLMKEPNKLIEALTNFNNQINNNKVPP